MKRIECFIQPYNLDLVAEHLVVEGVYGMTVTEVTGFGVQRGFKGESEEGAVTFLPKLKVEMIVRDKDVDSIIDRIHEVLHSGRIGEGKVFVSPVEDAVRTRTGERGEAALR